MRRQSVLKLHFIFIEKGLNYSVFYNLQMLSWIITILLSVISCVDILSLPITIISRSIRPFLFFFSAFLKEHFPQHFFLLLIRIVILDVIVTRLVESEITVVIAIWVLVPYAPSLHHTRLALSWLGSDLGSQ